MASILLGSLGAASGSVLGGAVGASIGRFAGSLGGKLIDNSLFGSNQSSFSRGPRLKDLQIQTSTYGITIPIVYGTVRIAGNIIWATPLREVVNTQTYSQRTKGSKASHTRTEYNYFASFAVAICEGPIEEIIRVYAGNTQINLLQYNVKIYKGTEDQLPDTLIESTQGVGKTPAYRNLAYVVFDNLPLADFNNSIPNLNFEVRKKAKSNGEIPTEELIKSMCLIPGSGEFVYDTKTQYKLKGNLVNGKWRQRGMNLPINHHTISQETNASLALKNMQQTLPNVEWVSVVVSWFGTDLNIAHCDVLPGVEYIDDNAFTSPDTWSVAGYGRHNARVICQINGSPIYGGTINDISLKRFIHDLKSKNLKVMLYPMIFMDMPSKPWRGFLSGSANDVSSFFNKNRGYNKFIEHYANMLKGEIDGIIIGSEFKMLTQVHDSHHNFPAVEELIALANNVKAIVGKDTTVTYAADWTEYHHSDSGWYHLDPLWACDSIDVVGIDAYFPLSNNLESIYDYDKISEGWESGEGYDYYYEDEKKTKAQPLDAPYAWKNLKWWWENSHINPDGKATQWQAKMKKIWFTEYGFPSVDCCTNQPNVFYDGSSVNSGFPLHSKGYPDFKAQRSAIHATEEYWKDSEFVERLFLWTWDARPYPYWPDLHRVWKDGKAWFKGHWVQGKLGKSTLAGVLEDLCLKSQLDPKHFEFISMHDNLDGLVIDSQTTSKKIIELLQKTFFFDAVEVDAKITFSKKPSHNVFEANETDVIAGEQLEAHKTSELELPYKVDINYIDIHKNYQISNEHSQKQGLTSNSISVDVPIVMNKNTARILSKNILYNMWNSSIYFNLTLSSYYHQLKPGDILDVSFKGKTFHTKVQSIHFGKNYTLKVHTKTHKLLDTQVSELSISNSSEKNEPISDTEIEILSLPYFGRSELDTPTIFLATYANGTNWPGCNIYISQNNQESFELSYSSTKRCITGSIISPFHITCAALVDNKNRLVVNLIAGELRSIKEEELLQGKNLCLIGNEIIQFLNAKLIDENQYELSHLYRGLYSTEEHIYSHQVGERFILLDENIQAFPLPTELVNTKIHLKACTFTQSIYKTPSREICLAEQNSKHYSPVDLKITEASGKDYAISWIRRSRTTDFLVDYLDIPLDTTTEQYLIEVIAANDVIHHEITDTSAVTIDKNIIYKGDTICINQISKTSQKGLPLIYSLQ